MEVFVLLSLLSLIAGEYDYGYRVDNQLLKSFNDTGERSCCKECIAYTNCQSVNYNKNNYSCELNYQHISGPGKAIHAEYVYMDRSHCFLLASCSKSATRLLRYRIFRQNMSEEKLVFPTGYGVQYHQLTVYSYSHVIQTDNG
uniref:Apple domain-containing protein n=1 Tax=Magallana gigas TaxID=29159 RepID=A0A8W8KYY0_MAGGI